MAASDDATLMKVAVFGLAMSIMCTALISIMFSGEGGDYDYTEIQGYKDDLISFSGETMINQSPWVLTHAYTPYIEGTDPATHTTPDYWLYGEEVTSQQLPSLGESANIRLDSGQKSTVPLNYTEKAADYVVHDGWQWWSHKGGSFGKWLNVFTPTEWALNQLGFSSEKTHRVIANNWAYTGYRYVFDPCLPFSATNPDGESIGVRDGSLSLVWYDYNGAEGLSGGLDVYGGDVLLASYSATDIIAGYNTASGYASTYDFDFSGTHLTLSIRFDQPAIAAGTTLMQAWTEGDWSMAISSVSAGNFFDIEGSSSFTATAGNMIKTFIQIYTFDMPSINNGWMDVVLWLLVGLPMTMAMVLITLKLVNGFRVI